MKVAIVAVMVVLAMGTAFVGGLLVASKMMASRQEQPVKKARPITAGELAPKEKGEEGKEGGIAEEGGKKAKKETKKLTTDEMIASVDYSVTESRDAGKMLFRKKLTENFEATEKQLELESDKAKEQKRLATAIESWLERSQNR